MNVAYSKRLRHAFVVDDVKLKRLTRLLEDSFDSVEFSIDCADGRSYNFENFESVEKLINYENPKSKKILRLRLFLRSANDLLRVSSITFDDDIGLAPGIYISLEMEENNLSNLTDKIEDVINGMRPWYDVLSRYPTGYSWGLSLIIALIIVVTFNEHILSIIKKLGGEIADSNVGGFVGVIALPFVYPLYKLFFNCFPPAVFAIGQGISRYNRLKWFHGIIATFIMGLIFFVMRFVIN